MSYLGARACRSDPQLAHVHESNSPSDSAIVWQSCPPPGHSIYAGTHEWNTTWVCSPGPL
eukprot:5004799-Pyramimonas_sp.AAC.1